MGRPKDVRDVSQNGFDHALRIFSHFDIPEPNDPPAQLLEKCCALSVIRRIDMLATVKFDRQFRLSARQIEDIVSHDQLPREAGAMG